MFCADGVNYVDGNTNILKKITSLNLLFLPLYSLFQICINSATVQL